MGFGTTQKIYKTSKRKAENQEFYLTDYKRYKPMSKLKKSDEMINDIIEHIKEYSIGSGKTYYKDKVFYLQQTKKYIYEKYKEKNPNVKLSLTTFYRIVPKYFQVPIRQSDKCPICYYGKKLMAKTQLNNNELIDKKVYLKHDKLKEIQNKHYKN